MSLGSFARAQAAVGFAVLAFVLSTGGPAQAETMAEALAATLRTHPALVADRAAARAAEANVSTARSGFFPMVRLNSEVSASNLYRQTGPAALNGRSGTLQADQMVFDGFATARLADAADADRAAAEADYRADANAVLFGALRAYIGVLRDRELLEATGRFVAEHQRSIGIVKEIAASDSGKQFDLVQLRMRAAMAASYRTEREGALAASESQFREIVGHRPQALEKPRRLEDPGFRSLEAALAVAEQSHPAVVAAAERLRKRRAEREQAGSVLLPRVDVTARYTKGWDRQTIVGENDEAFAGMVASYALATGGAQLAAIRNAELLEVSAAERLNAAKRDVREAVRVAWAQREALAKTVPLAAEYLKTAFEVVEGYEIQYGLGRRGVLELLIIRNEIYSSESRLLQLSYDQLLADFALASQMGTLLAHFPDVAEATPHRPPAPVLPVPRLPDSRDPLAP